MSNCITVKSSTIFPAGLLDVDRFRGLLAEVAPLKAPPEEFPAYHAWWFLSGSAVMVYPDGSVGWHPGRGCRSSHTWRDLQGTLDVFSIFAKQAYEFDMDIRDDDAPIDFQRYSLGWTEPEEETS
jgi:hypothetical protein